jgi:predicted nucleic acid-binding protein
MAIGALPEFFGLDYEICTTDFVLSEIKLSDQREQIEYFIRSRKLIIFNLTGSEISEVESLSTTRRFKGITDKTVLWKSLQLQCLLLTGDKKLRLEAAEKGLDVHGTIWVIEQFVAFNHISVTKAVELLESLKNANPNLPREEIDRKIELFRDLT